ncbi:tautomerase family protein [Rhodococcus opacus]|uniref:Tautomerase family protein n=1 Tax=Rhodococcus opacus TaxID=37919 RepID=A0AAX3YE85_RHOOP|nr:tautomerase family protein [Rhodococcus opacus]ELB87468.1 4-oxalocrotonate tautomerase [Rhodococcus wratislaviensis IFP 2016]NHU44719.1 4-oxalocrotonate tautomerase [Rhodococcus sp. A14]MBA8960853.1 4-oxalocrotonate tautomerase family enzyme [Rhodococcus opacus]MBP2203281.1 4-oxalocrotonate tautomerase family enzyme [Rhodococcus opacus]MCZ4588851.1 tautomerase family protein [Rhodococcus opacus]
MPVAHFHLVDGAYTAEQHRELLTAASRCYSEVLDSPMDRVRAFIVRYRPDDVAVAGTTVTDGAPAAPYFTAIVLAGRPASQRQELAARFTDLIVDILGAQRALVRGQIIEVDPANWAIAGTAAATTRAGEITARAQAVP